MFWFIVAIAVMSAIYIVVILLLFLNQHKLIYHPSKNVEKTPEELGIEFEEITLFTQDNLKLNAWFIPGKQDGITILFCHGNAGNLSHRLETIQIFHDLGLNFFLFDYRGYGLSEGITTESGTYLDSEAAWKYLTETKGIPPEKIIIIGRSLGGAIATRLASLKNPLGLITESAFLSIPAMARALYPIFPTKLFTRYEYNTGQYLNNVKCPKLIMHSPDDDLVPYHHSEKLLETAYEPKSFLKLAGDHNNCYFNCIDMYRDRLETFIREISGETQS
jgi:pimeloyl-ACP methyl ester carboxylesterase